MWVDGEDLANGSFYSTVILDTTVFLEYLPGNKQWVLTAMACWWGLGQAIVGFIAWGFMGESLFSADDTSSPEPLRRCKKTNLVM